MGFAKLLMAWALSFVLYAAAIHAVSRGRAGARSGFVHGLLGLGILLALPTFLFALLVGWPAMWLLSGLHPAWLAPLIAAPSFAAIMWVLATRALPDGWRGAAHALVFYAAMLGLVWGCLHAALGA